VALGVAAGPAPARAADGFEDVLIEGNVALPETVYRTVLARTATTAGGRSPLETARTAAEIVQSFLEEATYELAVATGTVTADGIPKVLLDEGQLDRILFIGVGGGTAIGFAMSLDLPGRVFNRNQVEKELTRLVRESGVRNATYEVVRAQQRSGGLLDVDVPTKIATVTVLREAQNHELRIYVEQRAWAPGFEWGLGFSPPDGVSVDGMWRFADTFLTGDRLTLRAGLSVDVFELADEPEDRLGLTRAAVEARWFTPPLGADWLRLHLDLSAKTLGRDREDVFVDSYLFSPLTASGNLGLVFDTFNAYVGAGIEQRFIYRVRIVEPEPGGDPIPDPVPVPIPDTNYRPFFAFGSQWNLSPRELRLDRRETISIDARLLGPGSTPGDGILELFARYQKTWMNGWDEIRLRLNGAYLGGDVPFFDEVAFGDGFLRAAFLDDFFVRRILSAQGEYRASLGRDTLKVSVFNDIAVFEELDLRRDGIAARLVDNLGVGLHILAFQTFQIDIYTGVGITTAGDLDLGISVSGAQVF
jgi:hypothetical protein